MTEQALRPRSIDLTPGTRLRWTGSKPYGDPATVTLDRRKVEAEHDRGPKGNYPFHPGWWLAEGGGLADFVIDDDNSKWEIVP